METWLWAWPERWVFQSVGSSCQDLETHFWNVCTPFLFHKSSGLEPSWLQNCFEWGTHFRVVDTWNCAPHTPQRSPQAKEGDMAEVGEGGDNGVIFNISFPALENPDSSSGDLP
jgi:hypothetical protein